MLLETAARLKSVAGNRNIPVRCDVKKAGAGFGGNTFGHFSRGSFIGIRGNKLLIRPYRHGRTETYDPALVHLWKSRVIANGILTQIQIDSIFAKDTDKDLDMDMETIEKKDETLVLETKLENAEVSPMFIVAYMDSAEKHISFFTNDKSHRNFSVKLQDARIYDGDSGHANAKRCLGQIKKHKSGFPQIYSVDNLQVITYEDAKTLQDGYAKDESPKVVIEKPSLPPVVHIDKPIEVSKPVVIELPLVQALLNKVQTNVTGVQTALDFLLEERANLVKAQQDLINEITSAIQIKLSKIDIEITETEKLLGKKNG